MGKFIIKIFTLNLYSPLEKVEYDSDIAVDYENIEYLSIQEDKKNIKKDLQKIGSDVKKAMEEYSEKYELAL